MIDKISYYVSAKPGDLATFMVDITDNTYRNFRVSLIGHSKYMFFPSVLMSGVVATEFNGMDCLAVACRIKNQLEEKMTQSGLKWVVVCDSETEVTMMLSTEKPAKT